MEEEEEKEGGGRIGRISSSVLKAEARAKFLFFKKWTRKRKQDYFEKKRTGSESGSVPFSNRFQNTDKQNCRSHSKEVQKEAREKKYHMGEAKRLKFRGRWLAEF